MTPRPRQAKIVCTIGSSSGSERVLGQMIRAGMDVARLNFSHGTHDEHAELVGRIRKAAGREGRTVGVLQDLQGAKLRIGRLPAEGLPLRRGQSFTITTKPGAAGPEAVSSSYAGLPGDVRRGDRILIDDGLIRLTVLSTTATDVRCRVEEGGLLHSRKGLNVPDRGLSFPALTPKDRSDLKFGVSLGVDMVAVSFVREANDIRAVCRLLRRLKSTETPVIAKIEKPQAVENLGDILAEADGLMVARGDLGVEMPPEVVPVIQNRMIRMARQAAKPVITATQMLESMVSRSRPTRAEASDVANAIFDGTDAVMLSAETAVGRYPVETVKMMERIIKSAEKSESFRPGVTGPGADHGSDPVPDAIAEAAVRAARELGAKVIAVFTQSGSTARVVSRFRPLLPIYAFTPFEAVLHRLSLVWGVKPRRVEALTDSDSMVENVARRLRGEKVVRRGELIAVTAGMPVSPPGRTNFLKIHRA